MNSGKRWLKNITGVALVLLFAVTVILTGCNNQNAKAEEPSSSASGATEISSEALSEEINAGTEKDITDGRTDTGKVSENHENESEEEDEEIEEEEAAEENEPEEEDETAEEGEEIEETMHLYVNDEELSVLWEDNESVDALRELVSKESLTIELSMYGGFEQVGPIGQELSGNDIQMTTSAGDIVLYNGDQIVVFYGSNTWSYTKLGHVENMTEEELAQMLGQEHVLLKVNMDE